MTCPHPKRLQQMLDDTLPLDEQPPIKAHLETCTLCQKKLEQLAAGGVTWDKIARNLSDKPTPNEAALIDEVEKLQDTPTSAIQTHAETPAGPSDEDLSFLQPSQKPNSLGKLDHYEILSVVGKGSFGVVLKAFDETLHRIVAIKVLLPHLAANGTARDRFLREARSAAAVTHENVVTIHAVEGKAKVPYLVMQFVSGITLGDKIDKAGPLGLKETLRIGMQIAEGLAAANKHEGLVHRDIKPANILLENGVERVKITDFGLARAADDASLTQSGTVAGTPMYMSPEQANGEPLDHRSDLFSLGSVLYVMCTGRAPFRAPNTMAVLKRVCDETPTPVRQVNAEIPAWLESIVAKLHAKKPADRFQTAKEVAELLGQHLTDLQVGRAEPRERSLEAPATSTVATAVVPSTAAPTPASRSRWRLWPLAGVGLTALMVGGLVWAWMSGVWHRREDPPTGNLVVEVREPGPVRLEIFATGKPDTKINLPYEQYPGLRFDRDLSVGEWNLVAYYRRVDDPPFRAKFYLSTKPQRIVVPALVTPVLQTPPTEPAWVQLFNGQDLEGWKSVGKTNVSAGELRLLPRSLVETAAKAPRNFHLRMEVKLARGQGVVRFCGQPHIDKFADAHPNDGWFIMLMPSTVKPEMVHAELYVQVPGQIEKHYHPPVIDEAKLDEWFVLEMVAKDKQGHRTAQVLINGKRLMTLRNADFPLTEGVINLWNTGFKDGQIAFRKIEIKELPPDEAPGWVSLFNGKDLTGWVPVLRNKEPDPKSAFHIEGNVLMVEGREGYSMLRTEKAYENYELDFEFRVPPLQKEKAGCLLFLHLQPNHTSGYLLSIFPDGQGNLVEPGLKDFEFKIKGKPPRDGGWSHVHLTCKGHEIGIRLNGEDLGIAKCKNTEIRNGFIAIWPEANEVHYRNLRLRELPPEEPGFVQLFNGKNLTGWKMDPPDSDAWKVEKGILVGSTIGNSALRTERGDYRDFAFRAEVKMDSKFRIYFRHDADPAKPRGYMAEFTAGLQELAITLFYDGKEIASQRVFGLSKDWFAVEIAHTRNNVFVAVNGVTQCLIVAQDSAPKEGYFLLAVRNHAQNAHFRKIEVKELPPNPESARFKNSLGMQFALVPKGKAWLGGSAGKQGMKEVGFKHDFYLGVYEVTQEDWQKVMGAGANPSSFSRTGMGRDDVLEFSDAELKRFPVENVSFEDCQKFMAKLNEKTKETGWKYRLPTEEQWEYACRGGPMAIQAESTFDYYYDRPTDQSSTEKMNYKILARTNKVGSYPPNRLGLHDMHGNIWEWCADEIAADPKSQTGATSRVMRGGGWSADSGTCRAIERLVGAPSARSSGYGLRVARVPVP